MIEATEKRFPAFFLIKEPLQEFFISRGRLVYKIQTQHSY